jgi:hypothetical protein
LLCGCLLAAAAETKIPTDPAIEREANQVAADYLRDTYCQCGDSYYRAVKAGTTLIIDQYKATRSLILQPEPVSDPERLAGVEWKGLVVLFEFSSTRHYRRSHWSDWEDPTLLRAISESLIRKSGRWIVGDGAEWGPGVGFLDRRFKENSLDLDCAKIAFLTDSEESVFALLIEQSEPRATSQPAN